MSIKYDSDVGDKIVAGVKDAGTTIKSEIASKIASDYSALTGVGLFASQISAITSAANEIASSFESFSSVIEENKSAWRQVVEETTEETQEFSEDVESGTNTSVSSTSPVAEEVAEDQVDILVVDIQVDLLAVTIVVVVMIVKLKKLKKVKR